MQVLMFSINPYSGGAVLPADPGPKRVVAINGDHLVSRANHRAERAHNESGERGEAERRIRYVTEFIAAGVMIVGDRITGRNLF